MLQTGQVRPAAVAGFFYPDDPETLRAQVRGFLAEARAAVTRSAHMPHAIVVPHAGYDYSGPIAARAFVAAAAAGRPERVVLVGPAHRVAFRGISAGDFTAYSCPLGDAPVDRDAIADLRERGLVDTVPAAHAQEHCLEVMIPFLLELWGEVPIVPLLVGRASDAEVDATLEAVLREGDLLLVSSDLSHYLAYDQARDRDTATLDAVIDGRWKVLGPHDACGYMGVAGAVRLSERRGWERRLLDYRNSGDTAGDKARVVGYGAAVFG